MYIRRFTMGIAVTVLATVGLAGPGHAAPRPEIVEAHVAAPVHLDRSATVVLPSGTTITPIVGPRSKVGGAPAPESFSGGSHWWGYQVRFTRTETRAIALGAGSCSVVVGKLPSVPSKIASGACGLLAVWAGYVLSGGNCLAVNIFWTGTVAPSRWNC